MSKALDGEDEMSTDLDKDTLDLETDSLPFSILNTQYSILLLLEEQRKRSVHGNES